MSYGYGNDRRQLQALALRRLVPVLIGVVLIGLTLAKGCQEGPFGRRQVVALNPQQEAALGVQAFQEALQDARVVRRGELVEAVEDITTRLVEATRNPAFLKLVKQTAQDMEWELRVVDSSECNAFCLPGGKIVVYTGIIPVAETDAGLATVIGHEISHALAHHGAERMAQSQLAQIGASSLGAAIGGDDPAQQRQMMQILNAGAKFGILAYSRGHESEADHMGLLLMAAAGYDPRESVKFWERMQDEAKGARPPEFLSTHPSHQTRVQQLTEWIPAAMPLYEASTARQRTKMLPGEG